MEKAQAIDFITNLLGKSLRVTTSDTRMFLGQFKCTDADCNIVLAQTYEYRLPLVSKSGRNSGEEYNTKELTNLTSRYLGLVVIPGQYIIRIQLEEFISQLSSFKRQEFERTVSHHIKIESKD
ncbi:N-alpha-acetyltransferase 38, NatC auxiliary subunit [Erysiphe neolycopersici]|uniref:N-alpha-acetyltransferase 38, NatC auxiliary subunit n=1 Tax=Erysiphe neolycopersici TaxID=212602 RepID=A0A420HR69_9PEZI|nr:N-alpha-acetyltransferase 38, NatC auxiliary subunit [Erysiphe neolycopersici]